MGTLTRAPIVFLVLALLVGCNGLNEPQRTCLADGERAYAQRQYRTAIDRLTVFLNRAGNRPEAARALYVRGMSQALAGGRPQAYSDLEQAVRQGADPQVAWRASAVLGILHFEDEHWAAAAQALAYAVSKMPAAPPMDALLFRLGLCYERTGRWSEALAPYRRILSAFPQAAYAARADRRVQLRADHFSIQAGVFSQQAGAEGVAEDLRRGNLPASVQRESRGGQYYYVVLVGRYNSYEQAKSALAQVLGYVPSAVLWP